MDEGCKKVLAADVGGTKSYLGLYLRKGDGGYDGLELLAEARYENSDYSSLDMVVSEFLASNLKGEGSKICCATFGVAATVLDNRCSMTNLSWKIDAARLATSFGFKKCTLINDLVAISFGITGLTPEDLHQLQAGQKRQGVRALIAAGTGLGEALLVDAGLDGGFIPVATEGGHADFAPTDEVQVELLGYLGKKYGHVSYERIVSGTALKDIYDFFRLKRNGAVDAELEARFVADSVGSVITEEALKGAGSGNADCIDTLTLFVTVYGAEAGNLALKSLPVGGLYIGGGIAPKILPAIERGFIDSFVAKGRFEDFMRSLPVYVVLNEKTGLLGAAIHASIAGITDKGKGTDKAGTGKTAQ